MNKKLDSFPQLFFIAGFNDFSIIIRNNLGYPPPTLVDSIGSEYDMASSIEMGRPSLYEGSK